MALIRCPTCGARLELDDRHLGQEVDCGDCRATFVARAEDDRPPRVYEDADEGYDDRPRRRRSSRREDILADATATVRPPAVCLIVASMIGMLWGMIGLAILAAGGGGAGPWGGNNPAFQQNFERGQLAGDAGRILLSPVAAVGAIQMLRLKSYGFAMTAAIISLIPCTGCCVLNMPFGIWALVVLMKPQVQRAFELNSGD